MFAAAWFSSITTTMWDGRGRPAVLAASTELLGPGALAAGPGFDGCVLVGMVFAGGATVGGEDCGVLLAQAVNVSSAAAALTAANRPGRFAVTSMVGGLPTS
jgi:hypothetical protein